MSSTQPGADRLTVHSSSLSNKKNAMPHVNSPGNSRNQKRKTRKGGDDEDASDYHPEEGVSAGPRKRQKRSTTVASSRNGSRRKRKNAAPEEFRRVRGRRGLLERLVDDVPLELTIEVFRYLEPLDILRLARTSRDLRRILMSRSSEDIWRAARANVEGLPPLPLDLNEPQYATLAFDSFCHNCMGNRCGTIIWACRMRVCKKCLPLVFYPYPDLANQFSGWDTFSAYFVDIALDFPHLNCDSENIKSPWRDHDIAFIPSVVEETLQQLEHCLSIGGNTAYQNWLGNQAARQQAIGDHAAACIEWCQSRTEKRTEELASIRTKRKEAIIEKLTALGWAETITELMESSDDLFSSHKLVNQSKNLTERAWKNMEQALVDFLTEQRELLDRQRFYNVMFERLFMIQEMYNDLRDSSDPALPMPSVGDALQWRAFDDIWQLPLEQDSIATEFLECIQKLETHLSEWRVNAKQRVLEILQRELPQAGANDLALAKTMFKCMKCDDRFWYADIFAHRCTFTGIPHDQALGREYIDFGLPFDPYSLLHLRPWTSDCIQHSHGASYKALIIMDACGLDPQTTIVDELHVLNPLMEHLDYSSYDSRILIRWENVIAINSDNIARVSGRELQRFSGPIERWEAEEKLTWSMTNASNPKIRCKICHTFGNFSCIEAHLKEEHGVVQVTREHWYWNPGRTRLRDRFGSPCELLLKRDLASYSTFSRCR